MAGSSVQKRHFIDPSGSPTSSAKSHYTINDEVQEDSGARSFEMSARLGENDIISSLQDDCLISVHSHLDRETLDIMEHVSQKMHNVSRHSGWRKLKKAVNEFIIIRKDDGYEVYVIPKFDVATIDLPADWLVFDFSGGSEGERVCETQPTDVSDSIFKAIAALHAKHSPKTLKLNQVHIDLPFIRKLKAAFHDELPDGLELHRVTIDEELKLNYGFPLVTSYFDVESIKLTMELLVELIHISFNLVNRKFAFWDVRLDSDFQENDFARFKTGMFSMSITRKDRSNEFMMQNRNVQGFCDISVYDRDVYFKFNN